MSDCSALVTNLSVLIGTKNRLPLLKRCIDSVKRALPEESKIVVIDAGSTDGTPKYLKSLKGIITLRDKVSDGQTRSFNRVLKQLQSKFVCWISDDNVVAPEALKDAVAILERNQDIGLVALKVKDVMGPFHLAPYIGGIHESGILNCNQGMIPLDFFKKLGLFDEGFKSYGMDSELTTRVLCSGKKVVYTKKIAIYHFRDFQKYPGAFTNIQRSKELGEVKQKLSSKFSDKIVFSSPKKKLLLSKKNFWPLLKLLDKVYFTLFLPELQTKQYNMRDFYNVLYGKYISLFDLWTNRTNTFYLVQQLKRARG